jgi:cytochrome c-type biogenesis protein CcmH/NrfF
MPMLISLVFAVILGLMTPWTVMAEVQDETALDIQVREIAKTLRCTVCQTENIWESGAPLAQQMRGVVRERLKMGHSPYYDATPQTWRKLASLGGTLHSVAGRRTPPL